MAPKRPTSRRARRRAARWQVAVRLLIGSGLVVALVAGGLLALRPTDVVTGTARLETPLAPRVSETAGTMLRVSWRPVLFSDYYEVTVLQGQEKQTLRAEGTEVQVPGLRAATDYALQVRAVNTRKDAEPVRSAASGATAIRTSDRPTLLEPSNPTVAKVGDDYVDVAWDPVDTAKGYEVQLGKGTSFRKASTLESDGRTATFKDLDDATPFVVRVRATGGNGLRSSAWTEAVRTKTIKSDDPDPLSVATYNVRCHRCGGPSWASRRGAVASTIASHGLDVVGLQEAQQSEPPGRNIPQYTDLMRQLAARQAGWKMTDARVGSSKGTRLIYNTRTVELVRSGVVKFARQLGNEGPRYYNWGVFTQRSSGKSFLFVNTHLEPGSVPVRLAQAQQLAAGAARLRGSMPAVVVGDLNASQYRVFGVHEALTGAGFIDPLGVARSSHAVSPDATAEKRINTNAHSYNAFSSRPISSAVGENGTYIDYIFATPMRVMEFETVVDLDSSGRFRGGAPSDHNMLRAVVGLP